MRAHAGGLYSGEALTPACTPSNDDSKSAQEMYALRDRLRKDAARGVPKPVCRVCARPLRLGRVRVGVCSTCEERAFRELPPPPPSGYYRRDVLKGYASGMRELRQRTTLSSFHLADAMEVRQPAYLDYERLRRKLPEDLYLWTMAYLRMHVRLYGDASEREAG